MLSSVLSSVFSMAARLAFVFTVSAVGFFNFAQASDEVVYLKTTLPDQFETVTVVDDWAKWIIFAGDMDGYKLLKETFEAEKVEDLKAKGGVVIADISKMPKMISKMFAVPKMKKLKFKILLDQEGSVTKNWPRKEKELTLIKLSSDKPAEVTYLKSADDLKELLKKN